jgi:HD-like signal output (HDOD) protein/ActR/RegA family two-component response regulator
MKPQIMFVDDEPSVLAGLRRLMHRRSRDWDIHLFSDAIAALDLLDRMPIDVLVTDMRMPRVDGVALLESVRRRYPSTARVVLSGHGDRDAILEAVGPTQQYLSKPCAPDQLERVVTTMVGTVQLLPDPRLRALLGGQRSLPKPPAVTSRLGALLADPRTTIKDVASVIERDLASTAEVLKLVNSSFFGLTSNVTSIERAVTLLGLDVIRAVVLAGSLFTADHQLPPGLDPAAFGDRGAAACLRARQIARLEGWEPQAVAQAGLAALLHDLGLLVLATGDPAAWAGYQRASSPRASSPRASSLREEPGRAAADLQRDAFGCTAARASACLLGLWGFAGPVVTALAGQPVDLDDARAVAAASPPELVVAYAQRTGTGPVRGATTGAYLDAGRAARWAGALAAPAADASGAGATGVDAAGAGGDSGAALLTR